MKNSDEVRWNQRGHGRNIRHVADLVTQCAKDDCKVAVVVSALAGVTNSLIEVACQAKKSEEKQSKPSPKTPKETQ